MALENVPRECRLRVGGHSSHVAPRSCTDGERPAAGAVPFQFRRHITSSAARPARTASLRVLPPPETQPAQWRLRACHVNAGCALQVTARTSHNHLAPKERGLPPVQFYFTAQKPTATSAARRARAASSRVSPTPERQPAQWRLQVCRANTGCAVGGHSSHVAPRSCAEKRGLPLVQCHSIA